MYSPLPAIVLALALPFSASAQSLPDPTEPTSMAGTRAGGGGTPRWQLQSTLVAENRRVATINGETVGVGDRVNGARILRIEPYAVRLRTADGIIELTLSNGDPKQVAEGGPR